MAGYCNYSKSNNAIAAEAMGKFSLTEAKKRIANACGISQAKAAKICKACWLGEWHHTSKFYNKTKFYDVDYVIDEINTTLVAAKVLKGLPKNFKKIIEENFTKEGKIDFCKAADYFKIKEKELLDAFYIDQEILDILNP